MLGCEDLENIHYSTNPNLKGVINDYQRHLQLRKTQVFPCLTHVEMCNMLTFQHDWLECFLFSLKSVS